MRIIEPTEVQVQEARANGIVIYDHSSGSLPVVQVGREPLEDYFGSLGEKYYFSNKYGMLIEIGYGQAGFRRARVLAEIPEYPFESENIRNVHPEIAFTFFALEHDLEYLRAYVASCVRGGGNVEFHSPATLIIRSPYPGLWIGKGGWRIKRIRYHLRLGDSRRWRVEVKRD